ncbi:MAG: hypothetical protein GXO08_06105 [Aquificae bacterium]|nr:hypothetical protein [Aquificota bacterium]
MLYLFWVFRDKSSWLVFLPVFLLSLWGFKVIPQGEEQVPLLHAVLGILYSLLFALVLTCLFKSLKEKAVQTFREKKPHRFVGESLSQARRGDYKGALKTFLVGSLKFAVVVLGILGLGAAQFCVFGSPVCTFSVGAAVVTALFPSALLKFLYEYGQVIILAAVLLQALGLYLMGCFKRVRVLPT